MRNWIETFEISDDGSIIRLIININHIVCISTIPSKFPDKTVILTADNKHVAVSEAYGVIIEKIKEAYI